MFQTEIFTHFTCTVLSFDDVTSKAELCHNSTNVIERSAVKTQLDPLSICSGPTGSICGFVKTSVLLCVLFIGLLMACIFKVYCLFLRLAMWVFTHPCLYIRIGDSSVTLYRCFLCYSLLKIANSSHRMCLYFYNFSITSTLVKCLSNAWLV